MALATLAALVVLAGCARPAPWRPRLVVLMAVDTCRADHLGCYGYARATSPNMDRLAAEGVLFENAFSQSNESLFSYGSLMTGRYPQRIGPLNYDDFFLAPDAGALAPLLRGWGFRTGGFVAGGHLSRIFGFNEGFDAYDDHADFGSFHATLPPALQWLERLPRQSPGFLLLQGYDVHSPYHKPLTFDHAFDADYHGIADEIVRLPQASDLIYQRRYIYALPPMVASRRNARGRTVLDPSVFDLVASATKRSQHVVQLTERDFEHLVAHYDGGILYADVAVGLLMARLYELGLQDDTLVVVFGDHGEELRSEGFLNHRADLRDASLHVPLLLWGHGVPRGRRISQVVQLIDIFPTLLDYLGIARAGETGPSPSGGAGDARTARDGSSLRPLAEGRSPTGVDAVAFAEGIRPMVAARSSRGRLIYGQRSSAFLPPLNPRDYRYFDIVGGAERPATASGGEATRLRERLQAWARSLRAQTPTVPAGEGR